MQLIGGNGVSSTERVASTEKCKRAIPCSGGKLEHRRIRALSVGRMMQRVLRMEQTAVEEILVGDIVPRPLAWA